MRRHALFVGVNNYTDKDIHPLQFAVNDATDMAGFFKHCANFDRAEALTDPRNCDAVLDHIRDMVDGLGPGDEFVFFFAGHGVTTPDGHRLVCAGDDLVSVKHSWAGVPLERLKLETNKLFDRLFLLDACRTDVLATHRGVAGAMAKGTRDLILEGGGSFEARSGALTILCSCDDGECAGESVRLRHGLFSKAILELLGERHNCGGKLFIDDDFAYRQLPERMHRLAVNSGMDFKQNPQKNGPPILVLDGIASGFENSRVDESSRIEEQQRLAAIREKEEQLARAEKKIREERARQDAILAERQKQIEEERRRQYLSVRNDQIHPNVHSLAERKNIGSSQPTPKGQHQTEPWWVSAGYKRPPRTAADMPSIRLKNWLRDKFGFYWYERLRQKVLTIGVIVAIFALFYVVASYACNFMLVE